ncbi:hypothetical protein F4813DRAFT_352708 [Daldinia decipiens]|uniref:uncharacterized protein n=1 Tax=Daldinia decipiens TaxID=326647 RepID=UPI0020C58FAB|nr:uncharacterized protein F4813DRAFT_352708 [Daldinia decipiens]KAI1659367.1 hypothetical protein F4813DRAFT_352708 [Daldinia decipiens]
MELSNSSTGNSPVEKFLHIPYDQRWEYLRPVIIRMYLEENSTMKRLSQRMKDEYGFNAQAGQYQSHFRKWKIKKRITTKEKNVIISALGKRIRKDGVSSSNVTINQGQGDFAKSVDKKQLKRYINQDIRQSEPLTLNPGIFFRHNLPYAALIHSLGGHDAYSPATSTPHSLDFTINSPPEAASPSSPKNALSPTMQQVQQSILFNRARLFLEGRDRDLITQLTADERKPLAIWLHDFWIYSFMTVKYWGRGPETWDQRLINFKSFAGVVPPSPVYPSLDQEAGLSSRSHSIPDSPTQLCRWSIHYKPPAYESLPSPPAEIHRSEDQFDIDDESTWTKWPTNGSNRDLTSTLAQGLQENQFSSVETSELPFATHSVVKAAEKSTDELKAEAFGFAIMSRNIDVIVDIIDDYKDSLPVWFSTIFPFHLAARFLDGYKACCMIMDTLVGRVDESGSIGAKYTDDNGYTVLDILFTTIIRSHSKAPLDLLGDVSAGQSRYAGQEVDPCGRWDVDSSCVRRLYAHGSSTIPHEWKHMFCHTSVQAICHCISSMFTAPWRPNIDTPSGIFTTRCSCCGLELKVGPLHALVLTALFLANHGMPGENLFGMISCLVCLLTHDADPSITGEVSITQLLGYGSEDECQHSRITPAELASQIYCERSSSWTHDVKRGWEILLSILRLYFTKDQHRSTLPSMSDTGVDHISDNDSSDGMAFKSDDSSHCQHGVHEIKPYVNYELVHCGDRRLGHIWAAIQAELVTYRRLGEDDGWLSPNFDMEKLRKGLEDNDEGLLREFANNPDGVTGESKLKGYSHCGLFDAENPFCATREEVCTSYYANLDDWKRTNFIGVPGFYENYDW